MSYHGCQRLIRQTVPKHTVLFGVEEAPFMLVCATLGVVSKFALVISCCLREQVGRGAPADGGLFSAESRGSNEERNLCIIPGYLGGPIFTRNTDSTV